MKSRKIVDIVTIVMLVCAFGLAYYTGLVGKNAYGEALLKPDTFALIAICGTLVLMLVGGISELVSRVKNNAVTVSFTAFMAVQVVSFIGMCAISIALLSGAFTADSGWIRGLFIVFAAVQLLGYTQAVIYTGTSEEKAMLAASEAESAQDDDAEELPEEYEYYYTDDDDDPEEMSEDMND